MDSGFGRCLRLQAGLRIIGKGPLPDCGQHVGVHPHRHSQLLLQIQEPVQILLVGRGKASAHLHIHLLLPQKPDAPKGLCVPSGIMAQALIGPVVRPVESNVHPPGLVFSKKGRQILVYESAVGVDGEDHPHLPQTQVHLSKLRIQKRLPSGEQKKQYAGLLHLAADLQPLLRGAQPPLALHLLAAQADIAHVTVHIAEGQQLNAAVGRGAGALGPVQKHALQGGGVVQKFHSSLLFGLTQNRPENPVYCSCSVMYYDFAVSQESISRFVVQWVLLLYGPLQTMTSVVVVS